MTETTDTPKPFNLLVVDSGAEGVNWFEVFKSCTIQGHPIVVDVAAFSEISVSCFEKDVDITLNKWGQRPMHPKQYRVRKFKPDFILFRSFCKIAAADWTNQFMGLTFAGIPSANSVESQLLLRHKPYMIRCLRRAQHILGEEAFPLMPMEYRDTHWEIITHPGFPFVVKAGNYHAGVGKMMIKDDDALKDLKSILQLNPNPDHLTMEPYMERIHDLRVQKIGTRVRVYKRVSTEWKGNTAYGADITLLPTTPRYVAMVETAAKVCGGLDICTLDILVCRRAEDGAEVEYILELNGSASGMCPISLDEDSEAMRRMVLRRMEEELLGEYVLPQGDDCVVDTPASHCCVQTVPVRTSSVRARRRKRRQRRTALLMVPLLVPVAILLLDKARVFIN
eukprot:gnl/Dysnectes_brevis/790_a870_3151.p1 GENE.gnl/Dysnectes_brevis/790_a870_3151~~gnl/Dysnectes_brevis/790_a870_3151.p1  ORF type:complete len:404 (-),score=93.12 gnl/Dysnectes_brevis/790_a870_3151:46-1227(-)